MKYIAQEISEFTSINITATYLDYNPATNYEIELDDAALTNLSVALVDNFYYRSISGTNATPNVGNSPLENLGTHWMKWKVSNRYAMIDLRSQTITSITGQDIVVEFTRGTIDALGIGNFEASSITIEHLDISDAVINGFTQTFNYSVNEGIENLWDLVYAPYSNSVDRGIYIPIPPIGIKIRVTFARVVSTDTVSCGYLIGGVSQDMGKTLKGVDFSFKSFSVDSEDAFGTTTTIKRSTQDLVRFQTMIDATEQNKKRKEAKKMYGEIVLFVVDPSADSLLENALTLGKIIDSSTPVTGFTKERLNWSIKENI